MIPDILDDAQLLRSMTAGDNQALTLLFRRHQQPIYRFAVLMCGAPQIAEEVTQDVFMTLIREPGRFDPSRGCLLNFLLGIARNYVRRVLKRERAYVPLVDDSDEGLLEHRFLAAEDPFSDYSRNELIRTVRVAVLTLPPRYREVVVMCDFQELSCVEAALVLECAVGTVNSRLHRGHALLMRKLCALKQPDTVRETHQARCFA